MVIVPTSFSVNQKTIKENKEIKVLAKISSIMLRKLRPRQKNWFSYKKNVYLTFRKCFYVMEHSEVYQGSCKPL